jgi:hypothetical protein
MARSNLFGVSQQVLKKKKKSKKMKIYSHAMIVVIIQSVNQIPVVPDVVPNLSTMMISTKPPLPLPVAPVAHPTGVLVVAVARQIEAPAEALVGLQEVLLAVQVDLLEALQEAPVVEVPLPVIQVAPPARVQVELLQVAVLVVALPARDLVEAPPVEALLVAQAARPSERVLLAD